MKRLSLWELSKGLIVAGGGLAGGCFMLGTAAGWGAAASASLAGQAVGGLALVAGIAGTGYALAQLSAGAELAGHNFGATAGAAVGAFQAARRAASGELPAQAVATAQGNLVIARDRVSAPRDTGGPDGADPVSRFKLASALANTVIRWHAGKRISRKAMVDEQVIDQRYWNLCTRVLIEIGMRDANSSAWRSQGSESLDLEWVASRVKVLSGSHVWVLPEDGPPWVPVDLAACHFSGAYVPPEPGRALMAVG